MDTVVSPETELIREAIRQRIKDLGITQKEAAQLAGWSQQKLWNVLNEDSDFMFNTITPLLRGLGMTMRIEFDNQPADDLVHAAH